MNGSHLAVRHTVGAAIGRPPVIVSTSQEARERCGREEQSPGGKDRIITDSILRTRNARPYTGMMKILD